LIRSRFAGLRWARWCLLLALLLSAFRPALAPGTAAAQPPGFPAGAPDVASYAIDVTLDAAAKTLAGRERIRYANTAAEPIPDLVFHLYLNAFAGRDTLFMREGGAEHRGQAWVPDEAGWIEVTAIRLAGGPALALEEVEDGTLARAALPEPVAPGEAVEIELEFRAQLPRVFARTGYAGSFFMVGQWFPKLGVWQDGAWNAYPFHANAEFYADFGRYDVAITLPAGYVTGATGLPVEQVDHGDGTQTVAYHAEGVIDFAWTAAPDFRQESRSVEGVELLYLYLPEHEWTVDRALDAAAAALQHYGRWFGPYPYPRLTVVDVPDDGQGAGGMEYPMLVTAGTMSALGLNLDVTRNVDRSLELVVVHEVGHQWWQSVVASNEAEEPWLDEGMTEYSAVRLLDELYGPGRSLLDGRLVSLGSLDARRMEYLLNPRVPMAGPAWEFESLEYVVATYAKPALALLTLERTLGEETMLALMSAYYERTRFRHPTTEDFRAVAQEVTGQELSWFFDGLVYGDAVLNYTVAGLERRSVTVARQGELRVPTEVLVTFEDGSTVREPWDGSEASRTFAYPDGPAVRSAEVDPEDRILMDLQWADNGLARRVYAADWLAVTARLVYAVQNALLALGGW
jgi:hypothetical protein